jgi:glycosyltransferase involved in cell wall biosynthesis
VTAASDLDTVIVVPCYNEAERLDVAAFLTFAAATPGVRFVFVNDGSTDDTATLLNGLVASAPQSFECLHAERNRGKAESVRTGMLYALARGRYAGYWDADLATPLSEIPRFIELLERQPTVEICFGARVQLLGRDIQRHAYRHYIGRVFATAASRALALPVYDTQCGAKLFRMSPEIRSLFAEPFLGRWTFDVELIARLARQRADEPSRSPIRVIYELPLMEWRDAPGSKVGPLDLLTALLELRRIRRKYSSHALLPHDVTLTTRAAP